jgi:hypothetical protein
MEIVPRCQRRIEVATSNLGGLECHRLSKRMVPPKPLEYSGYADHASLSDTQAQVARH